MIKADKVLDKVLDKVKNIIDFLLYVLDERDDEESIVKTVAHYTIIAVMPLGTVSAFILFVVLCDTFPRLFLGLVIILIAFSLYYTISNF